MTVGDIKGPEAVTSQLTLGATTTVGQVVHLEADGKWDPVVDTDAGKHGVAITAGDDTEEAKILIYGRVEVQATGAAIKKCAWVSAGTTGCVKQWSATDDASGNTIIGTAMEAFDASGNGTVWVGLI